MSLIKKLIGGAAKDIIDSSGKIVDQVITSDDEKSLAKHRLSEIVLDALGKLAELQASVLKTELNGNWIQRSWRPIVMLSFAFIIVYRYFLSQVFGWPAIELPEKFWSLLEIGLGGYVVGRSLEKVATTVTQNIDMPFLKKKNRK